jgi:adenylate cyclase
MDWQGGPRRHSEDPEHFASDNRLAEEMLSGRHNAALAFGRRVLLHLPTDPRCKLCAAPFKGPFAPALRLVGKGPWPRNPRYCGWCLKDLIRHRGGAEIECSLLFADVRDSTTMAETMPPTAFQAVMQRFFHSATEVLIQHDAIIDKFVGDEVIGLFIPFLTGERHAQRAVAAGRDLLAATGQNTPSPLLPIGAAVNTGVAYVGTVGDGDLVDFTAMGDPVNVTARLASAAGAGELLVTASAVSAAGLADDGLEHRSLALKGKTERTEVLVLHAQ